jgi:hypothetical protein
MVRALTRLVATRIPVDVVSAVERYRAHPPQVPRRPYSLYFYPYVECKVKGSDESSIDRPHDFLHRGDGQSTNVIDSHDKQRRLEEPPLGVLVIRARYDRGQLRAQVASTADVMSGESSRRHAATSDAAALHQILDAWLEELAVGSQGYVRRRTGGDT